MQWGDFIAELWLYVPLIGFWLTAIILGLIAIASSIRDRNRPGGLDYEFTSSEPEERPFGEGAHAETPQAVRLARAPEPGGPPFDPR